MKHSHVYYLDNQFPSVNKTTSLVMYTGLYINNNVLCVLADVVSADMRTSLSYFRIHWHTARVISSEDNKDIKQNKVNGLQGKFLERKLDWMVIK